MPPKPMDKAAADASPWVALAVFAQPHGVSGRIKVHSFTDPHDDFAAHPALTDAAGNHYKLKITGHAQGMAIVEIEGITSRTQAELLRGKKIGVMRAALPSLEENHFYTDDLKGAAVVTEGGVPFGTVVRFVNYGASDIVEITRMDGSDALYAFNHATFPQVDVAARRLVIAPPDILYAESAEDAE